jgi:hypothetical protein
MTITTVPAAAPPATAPLCSYQEAADRITTTAECRTVIESLYDAIEAAWDADGTYRQKDAAVQEFMLRQQAVQRRLAQIERQARGEYEITWPRA